MKNKVKGIALVTLFLATSSAYGQERVREEMGARSDSRAMIRSLTAVPPAGTAREVSIALPVEFAFGKADLTANGQIIVNELARAMNDPQLLPETFLIEGHTDAVGSDQANLELSKRRAAAVKQALTTRGVAEVRLATAGYGELRLITGISGDHARNRRVEVVRFLP